MVQPLGSLQREILAHLAGAPVIPGGDVFDLRSAVRSLPHHQASVSRAVRRLVRRGVLEWLRQNGSGRGFIPADEWEGQVRYVRRGAGG